MQNESDIPSNFTLRTTLGIFKMAQTDSGVYEGYANGFVMNISLESKKKGYHYHSVLFCNSGKWDLASEIQGDFHYFDDLCAFLPSWIDSTCSDIIEDYAKDVQYLETPYGKLAFWAYNTHLDSTPLVFVHGGPGGDSNPVKARGWHLENPIYLFDQMGCGMSDPIRDLENFRLEEYYEEMSAFIDSIPSDKVVLIGASWGAGLSLYYAGRSCFRKIAGLVLPSPYLSTAKWSEDTIQNLADMGSDYLGRFETLVSDNDFGEEFKQIAGEFNAWYLFSRSCFREWGLEAAKEEPNDVFRVLCGPNDLVTVGKLKDFDVTGYLEDIKVPTLFVCGDSDEVRVERILEYHRAVKGSRLSVIPHAGHVLTVDQFDSYKAAITAFIDENGF